jgi:ligand-binding sensor domain-containing protein
LARQFTPHLNLSSRIAWRATAAVVMLTLALAGAAVLWHASHVLHESAQQTATASRVPFIQIALTNLRTSNSIFEPISSAAVFNDAIVYQGTLFLCGPAGLFKYDSEGVMEAAWNVGRELPPAALVEMAAGIPAGASGPKLLIATDGQGLLEFDGQHFDQILPAQEPYRHLTAVLPLASGRVLLGTAKDGVLVYDGKSIASFHPAFTHLHITTLAGNESNLWVGTVNRGTWHWRDGGIEQFTANEVAQAVTAPEQKGAAGPVTAGVGRAVLPDPDVLSIVISGTDTFVGTPMGVAEFSSGRFTRVLADGFSGRSLCVHGQTLYVGTFDEGVVPVRLDSEPAAPGQLEGNSPTVSPSLHSQVMRLLDIGDKVYALARNGLYTTNETTGAWWRVTQLAGAALTARNVSALGLDTKSRLWVGYFDRGLDFVRLDNNPESLSAPAHHIEDDHVFCINRIVTDRESGTTVVATANGLVLFDENGNPRQVIGRADGLLSDYVSDVILRPGAMILATAAGITFIDAEGARSLYEFQGLVNNHVYALGWSGGRHLLAGTLGGLSVVQIGQEDLVEANYTTFNSGLKQDWITAIVPVEGDWFVGTYGEGVWRFSASRRWESIADATGPFDVNFNAMLSTPRRVYVGTQGRGMFVYSRSSGRWMDITAGLPSLNVTAFAAGDGTVYVGTDNGLVRFKESDLAVP